MNNLTWSEFERVEMYVGTIISAEIFEEAKNPSYRLIVDFGEKGFRKTSAQITQLYQPSDLINKQIVAVLNFPPKQIANMMSECLILGAIGEKQEVVIIAPERKIPNGQRIG